MYSCHLISPKTFLQHKMQQESFVPSTSIKFESSERNVLNFPISGRTVIAKTRDHSPYNHRFQRWHYICCVVLQLHRPTDEPECSKIPTEVIKLWEQEAEMIELWKCDIKQPQELTDLSLLSWEPGGHVDGTLYISLKEQQIQTLSFSVQTHMSATYCHMPLATEEPNRKQLCGCQVLSSMFCVFCFDAFFFWYWNKLFLGLERLKNSFYNMSVCLYMNITSFSCTLSIYIT